MQIGLYTLSDLSTVGPNGRRVDAHTRIKETIAAAKLAEQAGLDIFGVGEHHRLDFAVSVPSVVLAAIAASTSTIRLTSAVTVLSTADPVRVYEEFATLDLVSGGRAEIIAGRGVFSEPFPLFGYDLQDYDALFDEKLALFDLLNKSGRVTWKGRFRAPLNDAEIAPRALQPTIPRRPPGLTHGPCRAGRPIWQSGPACGALSRRRTGGRARPNLASRREWTSSHCRDITGSSRRFLSSL
jgi:alkanesulfonate monooxygenase SsuD/methylene tetrahydromethanopterin reductase-like flavin-dependent oxidoreductase (luciferase family)